MVYYTGYEEATRNTAGGKAPADIKKLCEKRGYSFVKILMPSPNLPAILQKIWKYNFAKKYWENLCNALKKGDVFIYQHPLYVKHLAAKYISKIKKNGVKLVVLIHDLESLRKGIEGFIKNNGHINDEVELTLFKEFDVIICHNEKMKQFLLDNGFQEHQIVCLEIFDYLSDAVCRPREKTLQPSVAIAGTLHINKSGYIYKILDNIHNKNLVVNLYGNYFDESQANDRLVYKGSFPPEKLPSCIEGDFGLVWDGSEAYTCAGNTGEYLKYNNPHKTSLYLSSGLPVIVWTEAAIADFVVKNKVGITVSSLFDLEEAISQVTKEEYVIMCQNAKGIAEKLRNGYYFYKALDKGISQLEPKES